MIIVPICKYRSQFGTELSDSKAEFGTFGDFMNPFLSLASIVLLGYISFQTFVTTRRYNEIQLRPHLFFQEVPSTHHANWLEWQMILVSEAPAVNIFIRIGLSNGRFTKWVLCPPLSKSKSHVSLTWIRDANSIEVMYSDITDRNIYRIRIQDRLQRVLDADDEAYRLEINRTKSPNDVHIEINSQYTSMFVSPPSTIQYAGFVQNFLT